MYSLKNSFFILAIFLSSCMYGMESGSLSTTVPTKPKIAISFDLDDVISGSLELVDLSDSELPDEDLREIITEDCTQYPLVQKIHADDQQLMGRQIATRIEISEGLLFVYPVMAMIETIKQLTSKGYLVVAATNQPLGSHRHHYRRVLREHYGIDLKDLFRAVLTRAPDSGDPRDASRSLCYPAIEHENIHAVFDLKPFIGYFNGLQKMVMALDGTVEKIIHIDDRTDNVRGARRAGLEGIHFNVPGGSVLSAEPEILKAAITNLKNDLKAHGIDL